MRSLAPLVVVLTAVLSGAANAGNPWNLRCASMPAEQSVPAPVRAAARAFFPWTGRAGSNGLRAGPVYLLALSTRTAISRDGDDTDSSGYYLHRALIAVSPAYQGTIVLSGRRLGPAGPRTRLGFSTSGATRCTVNGAVVTCHPQPLTFQTSLRVMPGTGWRIIPTELRIGRTGCYQLQATGSGLRARIPLAVPGHDWGTPGWYQAALPFQSSYREVRSPVDPGELTILEQLSPTVALDALPSEQDGDTDGSPGTRRAHCRADGRLVNCAFIC